MQYNHPTREQRPFPTRGWVEIVLWRSQYSCPTGEREPNPMRALGGNCSRKSNEQPNCQQERESPADEGVGWKMIPNEGNPREEGSPRMGIIEGR
jgi:hypothetical protein